MSCMCMLRQVCRLLTAAIHGAVWRRSVQSLHIYVWAVKNAIVGRLSRVAYQCQQQITGRMELPCGLNQALLLDHSDRLGKHDDKATCLGSPQSRSDANFDMADLICSRLAFDHSGDLTSCSGSGCGCGRGSGSKCGSEQVWIWLASALTSNFFAICDTVSCSASLDPAQSAAPEFCWRIV